MDLINNDVIAVGNFLCILMLYPRNRQALSNWDSLMLIANAIAFGIGAKHLFATLGA